jgi:hypothetical protein
VAGISMPRRPIRFALGVAVTVSSLAALFAVYSRANASSGGLPEVPLEHRTKVTSERISNTEASIPPQCYTRTEGRHNPCYTCHQMYDRRGQDRLNQLDDGSIQGDYAFSDVGTQNHWTNLFVDRSDWLEAVDDRTIRAYVAQDNYSELGKRLSSSGFRGFVPDLTGYALGAGAFDTRGLARDGSFWVAFNYKPFPGTFWPTNGSTDDVVLRLPSSFRERQGKFHRDVYFVNLTLVELNIKNEAVAGIWPVDENDIGCDVDGDGRFSTATSVRKGSHYVGDAKHEPLSFQQFPRGTELMHSVRYVGLDDADWIVVPKRMKELRYMRKVNVLERHVVNSRYANERKEKLLGELPNFVQRGDDGLDNGLGWFVKGFIEDYDGRLRPQSYEEDMYCMGCHSAIGTTIDSSFAMARKVPGAAGWGYVNLVGMRDAPTLSEPDGEILNYLKRAGGGSEFRENPEMVSRWFRPDGSVDEEKVRGADVYTLITPSPRRALDLNKAYAHIVRHQSFIAGRDATWAPPRNVYLEVDEHARPLEVEHRHFGWDLRLDWAATAASR